jgi:hypothetical protein
MTLEIRKFLTCSVDNIPTEFRQHLAETANEHWRVAGFGGEYGWFLWCQEDPDPEIPEELQAVFNFAREHGCDYVLFDRDGELLEGFPTFPEPEYHEGERA